MFCSKCGAEIDDSVLICPKCGCGTQNYSKKVSPVQSHKSAKNLFPVGIALLVVGVVGLLVGYVKASEASSARFEAWKKYYPYKSELQADMYVYGNEEGYGRFILSNDYNNYKELKEKYDYYNSQVGTGIAVCAIMGALAISGLVIIIIAKKKTKKENALAIEDTIVTETTSDIDNRSSE